MATIASNKRTAHRWNLLAMIVIGVFFAFGGPLLTPVFAGAAMALSSVSVVTNALRLKRFRVKD